MNTLTILTVAGALEPVEKGADKCIELIVAKNPVIRITEDRAGWNFSYLRKLQNIKETSTHRPKECVRLCYNIACVQKNNSDNVTILKRIKTNPLT